MWLRLMRIYDKSAGMVISAVFNTAEHVDSRRVFENKSFRALKWSHFSEPITSEIFYLWSWSFFQNAETFLETAKMQ